MSGAEAGRGALWARRLVWLLLPLFLLGGAALRRTRRPSDEPPTVRRERSERSTPAPPEAPPPLPAPEASARTPDAPRPAPVTPKSFGSPSDPGFERRIREAVEGSDPERFLAVCALYAESADPETRALLARAIQSAHARPLPLPLSELRTRLPASGFDLLVGLFLRSGRDPREVVGLLATERSETSRQATARALALALEPHHMGGLSVLGRTAGHAEAIGPILREVGNLEEARARALLGEFLRHSDDPALRLEAWKVRASIPEDVEGARALAESLAREPDPSLLPPALAGLHPRTRDALGPWLRDRWRNEKDPALAASYLSAVPTRELRDDKERIKGPILDPQADLSLRRAALLRLMDVASPEEAIQTLAAIPRSDTTKFRDEGFYRVKSAAR